MRLRARVAFQKRDADATESAARELAQLGFQILSVSGRGINIEGGEQLYSTVFGSPLQDVAGQPRFAETPTIPDVLEPGCTVYFPTPPEYCK